MLMSIHGKHGPCIQYREKDDNPRYVSISKDEFPDISELTLKGIIELLKYPKGQGEYKNKIVTLNKGPYGFYIDYDKQKISVTDGKVNLSQAKELIDSTKSNIIREFSDLTVRSESPVLTLKKVVNLLLFLKMLIPKN